MSKLKSAIYGLAIGDALGVPFEFKKRGTFNAQNMTGYGTYNQVPGTWSDDTSMTIATCHSLKENNKTINLKDISNKFEKWLFEGQYTAHGEVFDCGITTHRALKQYKGLDDLHSNGNGSLMRVLPLAFIDCTPQDVSDVSAITHAHSISKEGCKIYISIAKQLLTGEILKNILLNLKVSDIYSRLKILHTLSENEIKSSGCVVDTLEASLWSLLNSSSYEEATLKAVNLGDDTDTVGAVTGGLAGVIYGLHNIPKEWIATLQNKSLIDACLF